MGNFNRGGSGGGFGGKKRFDNDRGGFRGDRSERPEMHQATCAECGKECSVPFRPTGNKPVYCSNCFGQKEGGSNNRFERRGSDRPSFAEKQMFEATCDKCHKQCEVPFRPSPDKPVFCNDCFTKEDRIDRSTNKGNASGSDQYKKQFEMLNAKLDDIMKILSPNTFVEKKVKEEKPLLKEVKKIEEKKSDKKVLVKKVSAPKKAVKKVVVKKKK